MQNRRQPGRPSHRRAKRIVPAITLVALAAGRLPAADLYHLAQPREGRSGRVSSHDLNWQNGNADWREIGAGETITLADIEGPGVIRHIWFTVNSRDPHYPRSLVLRMTWDDAEVPGVETPLGDFFGVGHGLREELDSAMSAITSEGRAYNCYWPMPFARRAVITITNDSPRHPVEKFYFYIDYTTDRPVEVSVHADRAVRRSGGAEPSAEPPTEAPAAARGEADTAPAAATPDLMYFHARYRQEWPASRGDYLICETQGRGHYVGTVVSAQIRTGGWFGEGDDRFYIHGDPRPTLHGTGTEDYFCDAWGFRLFNRPWYGVVTMEGFEFGDRVCVYRWHGPDPIVFTRSLRFTMEHKGSAMTREGKGVSGHSERPDYWSSVAFWYQSTPAGRFGGVPPLAERVVPRTVIQLERFADRVKVEPADTPAQPGRDIAYSGGGLVMIDPRTGGATATLTFTLDEPLQGAGRLKLLQSISAGAWRGSLDGKVIPRLRHADLYGEAYRSADYNLGYVELAAGEHQLRFECLGKRAGSRAYQLGIDALEVEPVTPHYSPARQ